MNYLYTQLTALASLDSPRALFNSLTGALQNQQEIILTDDKAQEVTSPAVDDPCMAETVEGKQDDIQTEVQGVT